jgi:hypothetical protein
VVAGFLTLCIFHYVAMHLKYRGLQYWAILA